MLQYYIQAQSMQSCTVDEDGYVVLSSSTDRKVKVAVDGKEKFLIIPLPEKLKDPDWENEVAFHPLSEISMATKTSPVYDKFFKNAQSVLDLRIRTLAIMILTDLVSDTDLPPDALEWVSDLDIHILKKTDKEANSVLLDVLKKTPIVGASQRIVNISNRKNEQFGGKRYKSVCLVKSVLMSKDLKSDDDKSVFGHKCKSEKTATAIRKVVHGIIGGVEGLSEDGYIHGLESTSNSSTAPMWTTLTNTLAKIHNNINMIIDAFEYNDSFTEIHTDFVNMKKERNDIKLYIPSLDGNKGQFVTNSGEVIKDDTSEKVSSSDDNREVRVFNDDRMNNIALGKEPAKTQNQTVSVFDKFCTGIDAATSFNSLTSNNSTSGSMFDDFSKQYDNSANFGYSTLNPFNNFFQRGGGRLY